MAFYISSLSHVQDLDDLKAAVVAAVLAVPSAFVASSNANGGWLDDLGRRHGQSVHLVIRVRLLLRRMLQFLHISFLSPTFHLSSTAHHFCGLNRAVVRTARCLKKFIYAGNLFDRRIRKK